MTTPTLPGTIPGLLRRCSPVLAPVSKRVRAIGRRAIVIGEHLDSGGVLLADGAIEAYEDLALDLSDPTGRAHAAWWVLGRCYHGGWPNLHTGARLWVDPVIYCDDPNIAVHARRELWRILRGAGQICDRLRHLSADDDTRLPDGSRWVDAEALRLVCLHVAGVSRV